MTTDYITQWLKDTHNINVMKVYKYGSRVYGTFNETSDYDFIAICDDTSREGSYAGDNFDVTVYSKNTFQQRIDNHEISALECLWVDNSHDNIFTFTLDKAILRESISEKVSHCWVKGKKKITTGSIPPKENDVYIGLKSLFHAFRICDYGCQIADFGKIVEYDRANTVWLGMRNMTDESFATISCAYKSYLNSEMTKFRNKCPKNLI